MRLSGEIVPLGKTVKSAGVRAHGFACSARLRRCREVKPDPTSLKPTRTDVSSAHKVIGPNHRTETIEYINCLSTHTATTRPRRWRNSNAALPSPNRVILGEALADRLVEGDAVHAPDSSLCLDVSDTSEAAMDSELSEAVNSLREQLTPYDDSFVSDDSWTFRISHFANPDTPHFERRTLHLLPPVTAGEGAEGRGWAQS
jgi:hypothetical protein